MQAIKRVLTSRYFIAIYILASSMLWFVSLAWYNPTDPSFNMASEGEVLNILGPPGAYLADFSFKLSGYASYIAILLLSFWGINYLRSEEVKFKSIRIAAAIISLFCFAIFSEIALKAFEAEAFTPGGAIGWALLDNITLTSAGIISINYILVLAGLIGFICFMLGSSFSSYDWYNFFAALYNLLLQLSYYSFKYSYKLIRNIYRFCRFIILKSLGKEQAIATQPEPLNEDEEELPVKKPEPAAYKSKAKDNNSSDGESLVLPDLSLFNNHKSSTSQKESKASLEQRGADLEKVLKDFGIRGDILGAQQGPVVTLYEFQPSPGTKSSRVIGLSDDIARSLSALSTRISVIPGRNVMGIELPRSQREMFYLKELIASNTYQYNKHSLPIVLGKDIGGNTIIVDLAKMPHLLVAGTTGSGKSVAINTMIVSLLFKYKPEECKFIMIDPKMLELSIYDGIPHLLTPVVTEPGKAVTALKWAVKEMESRYKMMSNLGVRNIESFNKRIEQAIKNDENLERTVQTGFDPDTGQPIMETIPIPKEKLPFIVIIVDEMADLMLVSGKEIEASIQRLAQMARAAGIHLIMATQRPSVDVITGVIKANFPSRVSFKVTSKIDSRTILGEQGAEQLLGMGDMLYTGGSDKTTRVHGPFIDDNEVERIVSFLKSQQNPVYINSVTDSDELEQAQSETDKKLSTESEDKEASLYNQAVQIVKRDKKVSTSYIQRSLRIGYNRAANIVEEMQKEGLISEPNHAGKRRVLVGSNDE
jgi:S-DNA-T family DNA segregation ATPase FtsK/SpoIIIE